MTSSQSSEGKMEKQMTFEKDRGPEEKRWEMCLITSVYNTTWALTKSCPVPYYLDIFLSSE